MAKEAMVAREGGVNSLNAINALGGRRMGTAISGAQLNNHPELSANRQAVNKKSYENSDWRSAASDALSGLPFKTDSRGAKTSARMLNNDNYVSYGRNNNTGGYQVTVRDSSGRLVEARRPGSATNLNKTLQKIRKTYGK